ncbi:peptide ABC transporter substrate-binding protein [Turicibacter sanguinis]|uniref:peptide ABC transporter substrate-binding protein n=1 Tax=Turicibacter sanguinis TaxID=154288 RepID=UPI0006C3FDD6|nr:peptide ABC transporter substrate-binding protein [Turicibacter sanguinis]MDB8438194.1 peptide ABC transporter substrate-binding protein [Turicibacter sanguinis]MDB8459266.1 peptide ABC transporter substrate-binding protein [Turicibacter sanguinis]MDB8576009.1 peptide ABC transporter substrate-binding protein [Turicibacter sanguinis]MDB8578660.1 peptide ABC transporter substrate-binding protein [Turicibacter sanguinis]MDB8584575.1 peptide ABC transporter substrate-binding protein [Turicibac
MNKKLLTVFAAAFCAFGLVACSSDKNATETPSTESTTQSQTTDSTSKKVLKLLQTSNIPSLVPWAATDSASFLMLGNILEGLVVFGENGSIEPGAAESWEISEDGLTYTFKLREDSNWVKADGSVYAPVTANDFVYSWKKLIDPTSGAQYNFMIQTAGIKGANDALGLAESIVSYDTYKSDLEALKLSDYKDNDTQTAQAQYDEAKADLEVKMASAEEAILALGFASVDAARTDMSELIDALGVTAVDEYTLKVELETPTPYFLSLMAFPSFYPVNEAFVNEVTEDKFGTNVNNFIYNGPFVFKDWKISERFYIEKNVNYWDSENVALDGVDFRVVPGIDNNTAVGLYLEGSIQSIGLSGANVQTYGSRPDAVAYGDTGMFYLEVNNGKGAMTPEKTLLANTDARKAINMAINKAFITDNVFANGSLPADYFVPKNFVYGPADTAYEGVDFRNVNEENANGYNSYNPEEAAKLWAAAREATGVTQALELEIIIFEGDSAAQVGAAIKNDLEANLGDENLTIKLSVLPFAEKLARSTSGDYHMVWSGWSPDYADPMTFLDMFTTGNGQNKLGYSNEEYDALIAATKTGDLVTDLEARFKALADAEEILLGEDQAFIPLYQRGSVGLRDPKLLNYWPQQVGPDYFFKWTDIAE